MNGKRVAVLGMVLAACGGTSGTSGSDAGTRDVAKVDSAKDAAKEVTTDAPASTNDWSCLGHVKLPAPAKSTLVLKVGAVDVISAMMLPGVTVHACGANDGPCAMPLATATTDATTGIATLTVKAGTHGFEGYWQAQPMNYKLSKYFLNVPYTDDLGTDGRQAFNDSEFLILLGSGGGTPDPSKGVVGFQIQDCISHALHQDSSIPPVLGKTLASGVSVSISPPGPTPCYFLGPSLSCTVKQTDKSGEGGFINVPVGWVTLTATLVATGQTIGTARLYSEAGSISGGVLVPDH